MPCPPLQTSNVMILDHMEQPGPLPYRGLVVAGQSHKRAELSERSPTMEQYSTDEIWVGLDVHQSSITAAVLHGQTHDPEIVRMRGDLDAVRKLFPTRSRKRSASWYAPGWFSSSTSRE